MEDLRINALMTMLGLGEEERENIEISSYSDSVITYYNEEYLVVTEEEAGEEFRDYQQSLIDDMGLLAFSKCAQQYIINNFCDNERLSEYIREDFESYVEDIKHEGDRLAEEMEEAEVNTEEEHNSGTIAATGTIDITIAINNNPRVNFSFSRRTSPIWFTNLSTVGICK